MCINYRNNNYIIRIEKARNRRVFLKYICNKCIHIYIYIYIYIYIKIYKYICICVNIQDKSIFVVCKFIIIANQLFYTSIFFTRFGLLLITDKQSKFRCG